MAQVQLADVIVATALRIGAQSLIHAKGLFG
jgi:hypothetical protein